MRHAARSRVFSTGTIALIGFFLFFGSFLACDRQIPYPVSPPKQNFVPPTPSDLEVTVGDRSVNLSWAVSDTAGIRFYRIYIADSVGIDYNILDEVEQTIHTAGNLQNGNIYHFRVSSVSWSDFEGYLSLSVSAVPNLYSLAINNGDNYTNSRNIILTQMAPSGTPYMQISDDSTFADATWENYATTRAWQMPAGDGPYTIYARFRDFNDNSTVNHYSDSIILDTEAAIDSVVFAPSGQPFSSGDRVHFWLYCGETDGESNATIGQNRARIELYDDGSHGDAAPGDGIFESDFDIDNSLDFENEAVFGSFVDRAGNTANQIRSRSNISVRRAPDPVSIYSITGEIGRYDRLIVNWNASTAGDFAQYRIYRSGNAGVDSSDYLARTITSPQTASLTDTGLVQNSTYYYRIFVIDHTGLWAGSDEVSGVTSANAPPETVTVYPAVAVPGTHDRLSVSWSACSDQDFLRYELFRSQDNLVDTSDVLAFTSGSEESFTDEGLLSNSVYYYRVLALDRAGNSTWSNIVSGRTGEDEAPDGSTLHPILTQPDNYVDVDLSWNQPALDDFADYRVYSWRDDLGRDDSVLVAVLTDQASRTYTHHPVMPAGVDTVRFWYVVQTYDIGGNSAASNSVMAELIDIAPAQTGGAVIPDSNFISVNWIPTEIPDFGNYKLLRDTLASPAQAVTVYMTPNRETSSFSDFNTAQGQTYYYWLEIFDRRNHSSRTFLGSARW